MKCIWKHCLAASIAFAIGAAGAAEGSRPGDKPLVVNGDLSLTTLDFDAYMERVPPSVELARRHYVKAVELGAAPDEKLAERIGK